jgi:Flp pilus assembly protein CpaB
MSPPETPAEAGPPARSAGTIRARRGLPNGRAVAGGLLVTIAALGAWVLASGTGGATRSYVVAARDLPPGHRIVASDLTTASLDLPAAQAKGLFLTPEGIEGGVTRGPVQQGSLLTAADVAATVGEDARPTRELSMELPAANAVNGALSPGDRVDVVATDGARSEVLVQQALVIAIAGGGGDLVGGGSGTVVVTLALDDPAAALAAANGAASAKITLLRSTLADDRLPGSATLGAQAANSSNPANAAAPTSGPNTGGPNTAATVRPGGGS